MDNIDRFLRILYKDCNLRRLFQVYEAGENLAVCFSLVEPACKKRVISDYQWIYPNNYNEDVLEHMLDYYIESTRNTKGEEGKVHKTSDATLMLEICVNEMLVIEDNTIKVKFRYIQEWDGLTNKIDSNILIGLKCAIEKVSDHVLFQQKESVLRYQFESGEDLVLGDIAENHMHLKGSGYTTEMSMNAILHNAMTSVDKLGSDVGRLHYDDRVLGMTGDEAAENIRKIKLIRLFLEDLQNEESQFGREERKRLIKERYLYAEDNMSQRLRMIDDALERKHQDLVGNEVGIKDSPVKRYFVLSRYYFCKAFCYLYKMDDSIENREKMDEFRYLLNIYIAGISKLRFIFAQDNTGMGFTRFKRYEDRKTEILGNIQIRNCDIYQSVFDKYGQEGNIKKVEFRIAPCSSGKDYLKLCKELGEIERKIPEQSNKIFEYAYIIHFIKPKDAGEFETTMGYHRYEKYLERQKRGLYTLMSLIEKGGVCAEKIVGIDTANYELNCPPEVFAGMFQELKCYMLKCCHRRLFVTHHVGEDFRNVVTGMRRVDEAMEFLEMEKGDRLGHALAIGLDLKRYFASSRYYITTTKQEWVDDLAWMHHILVETSELEDELRDILCMCYPAN